MLQKRPYDSPPDPETLMIGKCQICGSHIEIERFKAEPPPIRKASGSEPGIWNDLYSCECPNCKENSPRVVGPKVGTRVYLMAKPKGAARPKKNVT